MEKEFTIVICTYNGEKVLPLCLDAILKLYHLNEFVDRVIVVDNKSTDGTKQVIEEYRSKADIIKYEYENKQGLSNARIHAINAVTPWIIYVDDDNILDCKWVQFLHETVRKYPKAGVINGAVIAYPTERLSEDEQNILKVMYRNLACTHIEEPKGNEPTNRNPMGAGMCIRTEALKLVAENGWLKLTGRNGEMLSSGEDSELCNNVFEQGYSYICNYQMKLYHLIPKRRLSGEYTEKILKGLVAGRVALLKSQNHAFTKCKARKIKYAFIWIASKVGIKYRKKGSYGYWKARIDNICAAFFLNML